MLSQLHEIPTLIFKFCGVVISWAYLFSSIVCLSLSRYILIAKDGWRGFDRTTQAKTFSTNSTASRHRVATISKTLTFEVPKFSQTACGLASGRGSWGRTPLHFAAGEGHDSVVQRFVEAKAAVDAEGEDSRCLGGGFDGGNLLRDGIVVKWRKMLMVQVFRWFCFDFLESVPVCQNICTKIFCCSLWSRWCRCLDFNLLCSNRMK